MTPKQQKTSQASPGIYLITVIGFPRGDLNEKTRTRCWGYYHNKETAIQSIKKNWTDIFEMAYYQYALVEYLLPGVCRVATEIAWFGATYPDGFEGEAGAVEIEKPEFAVGTCNWCLG